MPKLKLITKIADQPWELDEICRLNHQTFSEEIPQHTKTANGLLIDKFHHENQYIICLHENELVGMLALRSIRPFSLDSKLDNIDAYLPPHKLLCEIRLLVVKPNYRGTQVFLQLYKKAFSEFIKNNYDYAVMSGIIAQQKLYRNIGFVPFGPLVGDVVRFQPMYSCPDYFFNSKHKKSALSTSHKIINVLPGPVTIKNIISDEYKHAAESHRGDSFKEKFLSVNKSLCAVVQSKRVQVLTGSGTLANDVMLAHLSTLASKGLILSNGEFGNRIVHQAHCFNVNFDVYKVESGGVFDMEHISDLINNNKFEWLFFVHCETSTGVLNDFSALTQVCEWNNILVLVDCISTFGIIPLDLSKIYMASASSGKAVGSYAGLSMVFFNELLESKQHNIPVYLDIKNYIRNGGIPFTISSNAVYALGAALELLEVKKKFNAIQQISIRIRHVLSNWGFDVGLNNCEVLHPAIITIQLSKSLQSITIGRLLEDNNVFVNYNSDYLIQKNSIQICLFSDIEEAETDHLLNTLKHVLVDAYNFTC